MRKGAVAAFFAGLVTYPLALHLTTGALGLMVISHGADNASRIDHGWLIGRTLSVASVVLLVTSVVLAILAPPTRERRRMWWAVPATVIAIAIIYFDWIGFGFSL
jgi:uncharacterized BrkB/YihY/UPF0761 family membrane protein